MQEHWQVIPQTEQTAGCMLDVNICFRTLGTLSL